MTQNSVLNQNWIKCIVCTPMDPGCTHATRALRPSRPCCIVSWHALVPYRGRAPGRVAACGRPCHGYVATRTRTLTRSVIAPLGHDTSLYRNTAPCCTSCRAVSRAHNTVSWRILRRIAACITAPIATQMPPQATIQSLYRDTLR